MVDYKKRVLDAYIKDETDMGRFTSQDICNNLRENVTLTPDEVTEYMLGRGFALERRDDRMVWRSF